MGNKGLGHELLNFYFALLVKNKALSAPDQQF